MSNELMPINEISTLAAAVAKSHMINGIDTVEQAFTLMMICQAEGLHPMKALARYHIIEGRPSWKADALLAAFKERGGHYTFTERTDQKVVGVFEKDGDKQIVEWTYKMAEAAGLVGKKNWKYPRQMLTARVIGEGVRLMDPGISGGFYTSEETTDVIDDDNQEKRHKTRRQAPVTILAEMVREGEAQAQQKPENTVLVEVLTKIENAKDLGTLETLVKAEYKIIIGGMNEDDKKNVEVAFKTKKKLLVFGSVPGTQVTAESSAQVKRGIMAEINAHTSHDELLAHGSNYENLQDRMTAEDLVEVGKVFQARLAVLAGPQEPDPDTKAPIPETNPGPQGVQVPIFETKPAASETPVPETTKAADPFIAGLEKDKAAEPAVEPSKTVQAIAESMGKRAAEASVKITFADGPGSFHADVQDRMKQAEAREAAAPHPYIAKVSADLVAETMPKILEIKTRAMADALQNRIEDKAGDLTKPDFTKLQEAIEEKRAAIKVPVSTAPKKLEQTRLPGTEEPPKKAIVMSYGESDPIPEWVVVGAEVEVCAYPGGKPYLTSTVTGPVFVERVSKQKCVPIQNVGYPVPVSCLKQKVG